MTHVRPVLLLVIQIWQITYIFFRLYLLSEGGGASWIWKSSSLACSLVTVHPADVFQLDVRGSIATLSNGSICSVCVFMEGDMCWRYVVIHCSVMYSLLSLDECWDCFHSACVWCLSDSSFSWHTHVFSGRASRNLGTYHSDNSLYLCCNCSGKFCWDVLLDLSAWSRTMCFLLVVSLPLDGQCCGCNSLVLEV